MSSSNCFAKYILCGICYNRIHFKETRQDNDGVFFAHIDLRYLMKNILEANGKGKIIKFDLYPLASPQEPIGKDKPIKCPKPQFACNYSSKSIFYKL